MNKTKSIEMSKMKQTVLNLQVQVLSFSDNDFSKLEIKAVDEHGRELPLSYRTISEDRYDLTALVENQLETSTVEQVEKPIEESVFKKRFEKEKEEITEETVDNISDIYLFINKDQNSFLIGSCSKDNLSKLKISVSSIDDTFEISEMISDEDAQSLEIELDNGSISNVFDIANMTKEPQIITLFNEE